jgi:hypothetical protein
MPNYCVKHIEDSAAGGVDIKLDERVSPMLPGTHRAPFVTRRRRPNLSGFTQRVCRNESSPTAK